MTPSSREQFGGDVHGASVDGAPVDGDAALDDELEDDDDGFEDDEDDEDDLDDEDDDDGFEDDEEDLDDDDELEDDDDDDDELEDDEDDEDDEDAEYEAGDVNTISAPAGRGGEPVGVRGERAVAVLEYIARSMADDPDAVVVHQEGRRGATMLRLHVAPHDMGRVIGRRGRTAQAIRTLVGAAGASEGMQTIVDIADD